MNKTVNVKRNFNVANISTERAIFSVSQLRSLTYEAMAFLNTSLTWICPDQWVHAETRTIAGKEVTTKRVFLYGVDANNDVVEEADVVFAMFTNSFYGEKDDQELIILGRKKNDIVLPCAGQPQFTAIDGRPQMDFEGDRVHIESFAFTLEDHKTILLAGAMEQLPSKKWSFKHTITPDGEIHLSLAEHPVRKMHMVKVPVEIQVANFPDTLAKVQ